MFGRLTRQLSVDNGATINIILVSILKKLNKGEEDLLMVNVVVTNFMDSSCKPKGY